MSVKETETMTTHKPGTMSSYYVSECPDTGRAFLVQHGKDGNIFELTEGTMHARTVAPEMLEALQELFKQCAMIHKYGGGIDNTKESNAAIEQAKAVIATAGDEIMAQENVCPDCGRDNTGYAGCTSDDCPGNNKGRKALTSDNDLLDMAFEFIDWLENNYSQQFISLGDSEHAGIAMALGNILHDYTTSSTQKDK